MLDEEQPDEASLPASSVIDLTEDDGHDVIEEDSHEVALGIFFLPLICIYADSLIERLKKAWKSPVYSFFHTDVKIDISETGRVAHILKCSTLHCQGKGKDARLVRRFTDKANKNSTSNRK